MSRPGTLTVYRWELRKLRSQKRTYLGLGAAALVPASFVIAVALQGGEAEDVPFGRYIDTTGLAIPLVMLLFGSIWFFPLITALVAGDIVASEDHNGTLKTILTRSVERHHVFAGKVLAALTYAVAAILFAGLVATGLGLLVSGRIGPEILPRGKQRVERPVIGLAPGPAHFLLADRRLVQIRGIPVTGQAAPEIPRTVDALVVVPVEHLHDDPLGAALVLVLRVQHANGMVRVPELDDVLAQMMRRAGELVAQRVVHPGFQVRAAGPLATHADVGSKEIDVRIEVAHVEGQGVLADELPDLLDGFEPIDTREQ